jgi:hypothetical protein
MAVCHHVDDAEKLYQAGATYVILPHYLGAYHATQIISTMDTDPDIFKKERIIQQKQINQHNQDYIG